MTPEQILAEPARVLSDDQRRSYLANGYLLVPSLIDADTVAALNRVTDAFVENSRTHTASDDTFDVAPSHSATDPRVRRLKRPDEQHPLYWEVATGVIADVVADLVGPDVAYHHSKLNFKWHDGDDAVAWHQDIPFYPHTNYSLLTVGIYLQDTEMEDGPVGVLPASHNGPIYDHYGDDGAWRGFIGPEDAARLDTDGVVYLAGRPVLSPCTTAAPCMPRRQAGATAGARCCCMPMARPTRLPIPRTPIRRCMSPRSCAGPRPAGRHHDPRPCPIPPDWSGGYTSIFAAQAGEDAAE